MFVQLELDSKEDELKTLQEKMTELQELMKTQHTHTELQVIISSSCAICCDKWCYIKYVKRIKTHRASHGDW